MFSSMYRGMKIIDLSDHPRCLQDMSVMIKLILGFSSDYSEISWTKMLGRQTVQWKDA